MGTEAIGYVLGQQCAPVLAGIKPSNLLIVENGNKNVLHHVLRGTQVQQYRLYASDEKEFWFLFDREQLELLIAQSEHRAYLRECGYDSMELGFVLRRLAQRFSAYKNGELGFPHEMGVLFGYPLKDVVGFIENGGKNYKMSGYLKVYDDTAYADRIFRLYKQVKAFVLELCGQGLCISEICKTCRAVGYGVGV